MSNDNIYNEKAKVLFSAKRVRDDKTVEGYYFYDPFLDTDRMLIFDVNGMIKEIMIKPETLKQIKFLTNIKNEGLKNGRS